jgi:transposase
MWEFRRDPASLTDSERQKLEKLFEKIPTLRTLYRFRLRFKEIFDTAENRKSAARWLRELRQEMAASDLDFGPFWKTYENWKTPILNYFDEGHTSAAVEGINNKARVITKRAYGLRSALSLWTRLVLDLNLAAEAVGQTIEAIRKTASAFRPIFSAACT